MRKRIKLLVFFCILFMLPISKGYAEESYYTYSLNRNNEFIPIQSAYIPLGIMENELYNPEDIAIHEDLIYIADTGNKRIVILNEMGEYIQSFGEDILSKPVGVHVDEDKNIYVADYALEKVIKFDTNGKVIDEFGKPDSPLFGKTTPFKPRKVSVDKRKNIYIIGEGVTNGMIMLNYDGDFLGFYGVNDTSVNWMVVLQKILFTEEQKRGIVKKLPPAPNNITIDEKGLVYSITQNVDTGGIKKLNISGENIISEEITAFKKNVDIDVDPYGNIFVVTDDGYIGVYDKTGNLLYIFGGSDTGASRLGLFGSPSGIAVNSKGILYVLDKETSFIQVFGTTGFADIVFKGIHLYQAGKYNESEMYWQEVLKYNSSFALAHRALGKIYFKQGNYHKALEEYYIGNDKTGYSEAFWELRYTWMKENLGQLIGILLVFLILMKVYKMIFKKKISDTIGNFIKNFMEIKIINEVFFVFDFLKHPIDSYYSLQRENRVSKKSATILYLILSIEYVCYLYFSSYIFAPVDRNTINVFSSMTLIILPLIVWVAVEFLVSTISDGEGKLEHIYCGTAYSFAPIIVFLPFITILTNLLTLNEEFLLNTSLQIVILWSLVLVFIMIKEIHNFTLANTIKNIFITLFGMFVVFVIGFILYVLGNELISFIKGIILEVKYRV